MRLFTKTDEHIGEEWKDVPGTDGRYQASNAGRLRVKRHTFYSFVTCSNKQGTVHINGKTKRLATVILETFVGPRPEGMWCIHIDGNKDNCVLQNLKWGRPRNPAKARLNEKRVYEMRRAYEAGQKTISELAKHYMCKYKTAYDAIHYRTWKWVP